MATKKILGKNWQLTLWIPRYISHCFQDKCVLTFHAEFQDGRQKWQKNNFWKEIPDNFADNQGVKNLVEITLSCTVSQINAVLHFLQNFKLADQYAGNTFFSKNWQMTMQTPWGVNNLVEITISHCF